MDATSCASFLFIPLWWLLLLQSPTASASASDAAALTVFLEPTAPASDAAAGTWKIQEWCPKLEEEGRRWWRNGLEDGEREEVLGMDSFTNQQLLAAASNIRYPVLRPDNPVCDRRGNCRPRAVAPSPSTRCTGWCRRDYNPTDSAAY